ncbi:unnamed protein product [Spirodela intermedia]|uniref:Uncharacterized protein n=1 Tax=Spirodela intermedia TaxID=51605 RepID=A0A7I8JXY0_SPIIN|nr:unnamed protein product [Spirodela intermedia]
MVWSFFLSLSIGSAQSTRFCSLGGRNLSSDLLPVSSSSRTTPKVNASPLAAPKATFILMDQGRGSNSTRNRYLLNLKSSG